MFFKCLSTSNFKCIEFSRVTTRRFLSRKVLGIETSCDDTGVAIITEDGKLLANALNSQTSVHFQAGGINPPVARNLHRQNINDVVTSALSEANLTIEDIDVIATTVKPGLASCLKVGLDYTHDILSKHKKPFIPIHHMEAHALTARFQYDIPFPYLVLLISGGHCLVAVAKKANEFLLLGKSLDDAPGEAFDKVARRLRLKDLPECSGLSGGGAIEKMAFGGNPTAFPPFHVMSQNVDCNFSFSGIKAWATRTIESEEKKQNLPEGFGHLENLADFCASFQFIVFYHIARRLQRALLYCEMKELLNKSSSVPNNLVISGGVASNMFARKVMEKLCSQYNCNVVCPPPHLCTDNGLMIAWNGVELLRINEGIVKDPFSVDIQPKSLLGVDVTDEVRSQRIKLTKLNLL